MGRSRSRSRSPKRKRSYSRSRSRSRDRDRERRKRRRRSSPSPRRTSRERYRSRSRSRSRSREKRRNRRSRSTRSRSSSRGRTVKEKPREDRNKVKKVVEIPTVITLDDDEAGGMSIDELEMMKTMGFSNFNSSKGKQIDGNDVGAVHRVVHRKYRQYMNRKGGFNRPLDYVN